ncbi:MAG: cupin domain-containing protein [Chloroflexi bacterium]|nr:cupin domain-containing protein [Chloroflexota bacterium]
MIDKTRTMAREPGNAASMYEVHVKARRDFIERQNTGKLLIKSNEREFQVSRQGKAKKFLYPDMWPENALQEWSVFLHEIVTHSGKHRHQGSLVIFVLEGRGYTVVDGVRMDWKKGDLILLPLKPGGIEHQHFNLDPSKSSKWMAFIYIPMYNQVASFTEQIELCPLYTAQSSQ